MVKRGFLSKISGILLSDPGETRTHGQWLKRPMFTFLLFPQVA